MQINKKIILFLLFTISFFYPSIAKAQSEYESTVNIPVRVELEGDIDVEEFEIYIEKQHISSPEPENTVIKLSQNSDGTFGPISYNKPGKHVYMIKQITGQHSDIEYDTNLYKVTVMIENERDSKDNFTGKLKSSIFVEKNDSQLKEDIIIFENKYNKVETSEKKETIVETETTKEKPKFQDNPYTSDNGIATSLVIFGVSVVSFVGIKKKKYGFN